MGMSMLAVIGKGRTSCVAWSGKWYVLRNGCSADNFNHGSWDVSQKIGRDGQRLGKIGGMNSGVWFFELPNILQPVRKLKFYTSESNGQTMNMQCKRAKVQKCNGAKVHKILMLWTYPKVLSIKKGIKNIFIHISQQV